MLESPVSKTTATAGPLQLSVPPYAPPEVGPQATSIILSVQPMYIIQSHAQENFEQHIISAVMDNVMLKLDEFVTGIFSRWDIYSSLIFASIFGFFIYSVISARDPDAHPMLLARQSQASQVRQEGESSVFRSQSAPHGMPLNSGLNVKDAGDSKWSRGRDGDLRDVWTRVVGGKLDKEGKETGEKGKIMTVLGSEKVIVHDLGNSTHALHLYVSNANTV